MNPFNFKKSVKLTLLAQSDNTVVHKEQLAIVNHFKSKRTLVLHFCRMVSFLIHVLIGKPCIKSIPLTLTLPICLANFQLREVPFSERRHVTIEATLFAGLRAVEFVYCPQLRADSVKY